MTVSVERGESALANIALPIPDWQTYGNRSACQDQSVVGHQVPVDGGFGRTMQILRALEMAKYQN